MNMNASTNEANTTLAVGWKSIMLGVVLYIVVGITILGNTLVLVAIKREKKLQTVFNFYIVNLAITDIAVAVTAMSFYSLNITLGYWPFGSFMCGVWIFFDYGMTFASVFTLIIISLDRFWSVTWTLHYKSHNSKRKAIKFIIGIWIFMILLWLPPCIIDRVNNSMDPKTCIWDPANNKEYVFVIATLGHHGSFIILLVCYIKVLYVVAKQRNKIHSMQSVPRSALSDQTEVENEVVPEQMSEVAGTSNDMNAKVDTTHQTGSPDKGNQGPDKGNQGPDTTVSFTQIPVYKQQKEDAKDTTIRNSNTCPPQKKQNNVRRQRSKELKIFITLSYIIIGYAFCWLPFHFVFDVSAFKPDQVPNEVYIFTFWLSYFNSTLNPFLYNFSSKDFRDAFKKILRIGQH